MLPHYDGYPYDFPDAAKAKVELAKIRGAKAFKKAKEKSTATRYQSALEVQKLLKHYILRVFLVFTDEMCELGRAGAAWPVVRIRSEAEKFLLWFKSGALSELGFDIYGKPLADNCLQLRDLMVSQEWKRFENKLLGLARLQSGLRPSPAETRRTSAAIAASWESIKITFLSDERVEILNGTNRETHNYGELGFEDGRTGKPNKAWEELRDLAKAGGIIRDAAGTSRTWPKVEKRVQEVRKALRRHFGITADPLPFIQGTGYRACFKVECAASFDT